VLPEIENALLRRKQYLTASQKVWFVVIAASVVLVQFCVMGVTIAAQRYWLLIPELPLLWLAILAMNLLRAAATSLPPPAGNVPTEAANVQE
jgi:hypothetical protein